MAVDSRCFSCPLPECDEASNDCPIRHDHLVRRRAVLARRREQIRAYNRTYKRKQRAQQEQGAD